MGRLSAVGRFLVQRGKDGRYSIIDRLNHDNELFISRFETETQAQKFIDEFLDKR